MKLIEHLQKAKKTLFTCEIVPPLKGHGINELWKVLDKLVEFQPAIIDVTYHRQEIISLQENNHISRERKRPGTLGICGAILQRYQIDPAPHVICGGMDRYSIEDMLLDIHYLGIQNILILQGDKSHHEKEFIPVQDGYSHASELLEQVQLMEQGRFLDPDLSIRDVPDFCIGVAGYPEKHFFAPSMESDLAMLQKKVSLGADYIITQMFFDNKYYFNFVSQCRKLGITIPILPGIKPITSKKQLTSLPKTFSLQIPENLASDIYFAKNDAEVQKIGMDWCVEQCKELLKNNVPSLHFYTMSKIEPTVQILQQIF